LHVFGAWLTGSLLKEAADDLRNGRRIQWGGREYDLGGFCLADREQTHLG
jgi:hypothetical protein